MFSGDDCLCLTASNQLPGAESPAPPTNLDTPYIKKDPTCRNLNPARAGTAHYLSPVFEGVARKLQILKSGRVVRAQTQHFLVLPNGIAHATL